MNWLVFLVILYVSVGLSLIAAIFGSKAEDKRIWRWTLISNFVIIAGLAVWLTLNFLHF